MTSIFGYLSITRRFRLPVNIASLCLAAPCSLALQERARPKLRVSTVAPNGTIACCEDLAVFAAADAQSRTRGEMRGPARHMSGRSNSHTSNLIGIASSVGGEGGAHSYIKKLSRVAVASVTSGTAGCLWTKPDSCVPVPRLSYCPREYAVGTGLYLDDVEAT